MAMAVANTYARALADVVAKEGNYSVVLGDLEKFLEVYRESAELQTILETPAIPVGKKIAVLEAILARLGVAKVSGNFLRALVTNYRVTLIEDICAAFIRIANERLGIVRVLVSSATVLSVAEQQALRSRFEVVTGKRVEMEFRRNSELLGGILAQIESTVYDGTVRGHLEQIRERLMAR